ncbi:MAG: hypothetical protein ACOCXH_16510 [Cyclobacteriaceae bacterium]
MEQARKIKRYWLLLAIAGLLLIGFGLSLAGEAIIAKSKQESWFWLGTLALVVFNSGISIFGQAIIYRWKYLKLKDKNF